MELLLVLDTSNNVKIFDYRIMKEVIKTFLTDNFDLKINNVRVGVIKYGEMAEVPISLGDYDDVDNLLLRLSETRRLKGVANLNNALYKASEEFYLSSVDYELPPRVVIIWKNSNSRFVILQIIKFQTNF